MSSRFSSGGGGCGGGCCCGGGGLSTAIAAIPPNAGPAVLLWVEARAEDRLVTAVLVVGWLELLLLVLDEAEEERNRYRVLSSVVAPVI